MTDTFRSLCAELVELDQAEPSDYANPDVLRDWRQNWNAAIDRARAALLAQPEPQGPTNERLTWLWNHLQVSRRQLMALRGENCLDDTDYQQFARSVLRQWGRPAIKPVPVSDPPGPKDCDGEGRCWLHQPHPATPETPVWRLMPARFASIIYSTTHWLPHWALPVPGVEGADG